MKIKIMIAILTLNCILALQNFATFTKKTKDKCGPILCAPGGCCYNTNYSVNAVCRAAGNVCCYDEHKMVIPLMNCSQCTGVFCEGDPQKKENKWPPTHKPKPAAQCQGNDKKCPGCNGACCNCDWTNNKKNCGANDGSCCWACCCN